MLLQLTLCGLLCHLVSGFTTQDCPPAFHKDKYLQVYQGKCYYFHLEKNQDYGDAGDTCYREGGSLVMIKNKDVNRFLHEKLEYTYTDVAVKGGRVWIGLEDLRKEGNFRWADGSPMVYENFAAREGPNASPAHVGFDETEDCVAMDNTDGKWFDYKCESTFLVFDEHRPFICEADAVSSSSTATTPVVTVTATATTATATVVKTATTARSSSTTSSSSSNAPVSQSV